tara:strand:- start:6654 stop:7145 length:492 start_codon:yes stop_codon:yes gene_type:complete
MSKTKALLEGLGNIVRKPSAFREEKFDSYTNRFYITQHSFHKLPAKYDKAKRHKDAEGDEYIKIDRVYGGLYEQQLQQADGTIYKGKLVKKRRLITNKGYTGEQDNFYSRCIMTADGRWFDNGGMPIEAPTKLEPEKKPDPEDIEEQKRLAKQREANILANLK